MPKPIASTQISVRPEDSEVANRSGDVGSAAYVQYCDNGLGIMLADLVAQFAASRVGARRLIGASSDGKVILGYIPKETVGTNDLDKDWDRQFRLYDAATGQTIATSPPTYPQLSSCNCHKCDPALGLSANGNAVVVFAPWRWFQLPIYHYCPVIS